VLSGFFDTPPDAAACSALLAAISAAASAPPLPPREPSPPPPPPPCAPAPSSAGGGTGGASLNALAADFSGLALPDAWPYEDDADVDAMRENGGNAGDDDDGDDGEWWRAAELADDPQALWGGTEAEPTPDAPWPWHFAPRTDACGAPCDDDDDDGAGAYGDPDVDGAAAADAAVAARAARFPSIEHATICAVMLSLNCDAAVRAALSCVRLCVVMVMLTRKHALRARAGHGGGADRAGMRAAAAAACAG
jgi:hypothetical protein